MATDDDELDDLVRGALKTLDAQVPSGYFEDLAGRTLARLAPEASMQNAGTRTEALPKSAPPTPKREEDSGLHDIRNLAETAKQRISSKRITSTTNAEQLLASTTGSFKSLALPQPAQMVSLPELSELAPREKPAKKAKAEAAERAAAPVAAAPVAAASATAPVAARETPPAAFAPTGKPGSRKTMMLAIGGGAVALAAVAAVVLFSGKSKRGAPAADKPAQVAAAAPAPTAAPSVQPIDPPPPPAATGTTAAEVAAAAPAAPVEPESKSMPKHAAKSGTRPTKGTAKADEPVAGATPAPAPAQAPAATAPKKGDKGSGEESFDALLKEAGVNDDKKDQKPVLDKKELSASDFKAGMQAIQGKALACYKGTQGIAQVKLVVSPTGKVRSVAVTGAFADSPEGACVAAAAKSATFPPWDGGSQTMGYSFLLSE